jgi:hypothetical protein
MEARHFSSSADQISQAFGVVVVPMLLDSRKPPASQPSAPDIEEDTKCL